MGLHLSALTHWVTITNFISVLENPKVPDLARQEQGTVRRRYLQLIPKLNLPLV